MQVTLSFKVKIECDPSAADQLESALDEAEILETDTPSMTLSISKKICEQLGGELKITV